MWPDILLQVRAQNGLHVEDSVLNMIIDYKMPYSHQDSY